MSELEPTITKLEPTATERLRALLDERGVEWRRTPRRADLVPVVRCRDCERFAVDQSDHEYRSGWWCKRWSTDMVKPDGFCAWASRKESE